MIANRRKKKERTGVFNIYGSVNRKKVRAGIYYLIMGASLCTFQSFPALLRRRLCPFNLMKKKQIKVINYYLIRFNSYLNEFNAQIYLSAPPFSFLSSLFFFFFIHVFLFFIHVFFLHVMWESYSFHHHILFLVPPNLCFVL